MNIHKYNIYKYRIKFSLRDVDVEEGGLCVKTKTMTLKINTRRER